MRWPWQNIWCHRNYDSIMKQKSKWFHYCFYHITYKLNIIFGLLNQYHSWNLSVDAKMKLNGNTTYGNHFMFFKRYVITPLTRDTDNKRKR